MYYRRRTDGTYEQHPVGPDVYFSACRHTHGGNNAWSCISPHEKVLSPVRCTTHGRQKVLQQVRSKNQLIPSFYRTCGKHNAYRDIKKLLPVSVLNIKPNP